MFQVHYEEYSAMVREIDGNEKVSEWMERNRVSGGVCCDPVSPLPELEHRVLQPDLLVQVNIVIGELCWIRSPWVRADLAVGHNRAFMTILGIEKSRYRIKCCKSSLGSTV